MCGNDVMLLTNNILKTKGSLRATFVENMSRNLTLIVDEWCSQVLLEAEDLSEVSAERERAGNLNEALVNCQRAIDLLKTAEAASDVSQDLLVRLRMKRNTVVLTSRRLQRQMSGQTHTSVPSTASGVRSRETVASSCTQQQSDHLNKEEVGEILVQELERRRNHDNAVCGIAPSTTAIRSLPVNRAIDERVRVKYEEMVRRQLKTFAAKEMRNWSNVENDHDIYGYVSSGPRAQPTSDTRLVEDHVTAGISSRLAGLRCTEQLPGCAAPRIDERRFDKVVVENASNSNKSSALRHSVSDHDFRLPPQPALLSTTPTLGSCVPGGNLSAMDADNVAIKMIHRRSVPDLEVIESARTNPAMVAAQSGRKKKTVTFSDNVKLVCIESDETIPVTDCTVRYPSGILKNSGPSPVNPDFQSYASSSYSCASADVDLGRDSDGASANDSEPELEEMSPDGRPRCGLCRRKWADRGAVYCLDCRAYMSKLQPTAL